MALLFCLTAGPASAVEKSRTGAAAGDLGAFSSALKLYQENVGSYPTTEQGLQYLVQPDSAPRGWRGPYMATITNDPWGYAYVYESRGSEYTMHLAHTAVSGIDIEHISNRPDYIKMEVNSDSSLLWFKSKCPGEYYGGILFRLVPVFISLLLITLAAGYPFMKSGWRRWLWLMGLGVLLILFVLQAIPKLLS